MHSARLLLNSIFQVLKEHKRRSIFSMLGVLFGILSLVAVGNISSAMTKKVKETLNQFGPNLIIVRAGEVRITGRGVRQFSMAQTLKFGDVQAIKQSIRGIKEIVPIAEFFFPLRYKQNIININIIGAPRSIVKIRNLIIQDGYFYGEKDEQKRAKKVVLGYKVWKTLFGDERAFGKTILARRVPCKVVGVLAPKGADLAGEDLDRLVYMPLQTVLRRFLNADYLSAIFIQAQRETDIPRIKAEIKKLLRRRHGLGPMEKDDFTVYSPADIAKTKQKGLALVSVLSKMAATISFTIGGLGIFAVMLLAVNERQREIGIRRAVGAKKKDILWQFLGEACVISLTGGILGIGLGLGIGILVSLIGSLPIVFAWKNLFLSLFISVGLGLVAGVYPAYVAASLMPLEVLKS